MTLFSLRGIFSKKHESEESKLKTNINIISSQQYKNVDVIYGTAKLDEEVYAAIIKFLPPGSIEKQLRGKHILLSPKENRGYIVEISSTAHIKYKEMGVFSEWPNLANVTPWNTIEKLNNPIYTKPSYKGTIVIVGSPDVNIHYNNPSVLKFFQSKFIGLTIVEKDIVSLNVLGYPLPFRIEMTCPKGIVNITNDTLISIACGLKTNSGLTYHLTPSIEDINQL